MFGRKARKNRAIRSWKRAAQLILPVAQTIGAVSIVSFCEENKEIVLFNIYFDIIITSLATLFMKVYTISKQYISKQYMSMLYSEAE